VDVASSGRHCDICGASLSSARKDARYCGSGCRAEAARRRKQSAADALEGRVWVRGYFRRKVQREALTGVQVTP